MGLIECLPLLARSTSRDIAADLARFADRQGVRSKRGASSPLWRHLAAILGSLVEVGSTRVVGLMLQDILDTERWAPVWEWGAT